MKKNQLIGLLYDIARAGQRRHILWQALSNEGALYWITIILLQTESVLHSFYAKWTKYENTLSHAYKIFLLHDM